MLQYFVFHVRICILNDKFAELELIEIRSEWARIKYRAIIIRAFSQKLNLVREKIIFWVILELICEAMVLSVLEPLSLFLHTEPLHQDH